MGTAQQAIGAVHPVVIRFVIRERSAAGSVGLESAADALAAVPVPDAALSAIVPGAAAAALHAPAAAIAAAAAAAAVGRAAAEVAAGAALDVRRGAGRSAVAAAARGAITSALVAARARVIRAVADVVPAARTPPRRAGASRHHLDGTHVLHLGARALTIGDAVRPARAAVIEAAETWAELAAARESAEAQVEAMREG